METLQRVKQQGVFHYSDKKHDKQTNIISYNLNREEDVYYDLTKLIKANVTKIDNDIVEIINNVQGINTLDKETCYDLFGSNDTDSIGEIYICSVGGGKFKHWINKGVKHNITIGNQRKNTPIYQMLNCGSNNEDLNTEECYEDSKSAFNDLVYTLQVDLEKESLIFYTIID